MNEKNIIFNEIKIPYEHLDIIDAFSRLLYESIYIVDHQKRIFEYVSENPIFLCGLSSKEVKDLGYNFFLQYVKKEDLNLLLKINEIIYDFYKRTPIDERKSYTISYDFHLIDKYGKEILINNKLTPIHFNSNGNINKSICIAALSPNQYAGNITINKSNGDFVLKYDLKRNVWTKEYKVKLSEREFQILALSKRGLTIKEIADTIFIIIDTIKFHRKKIFDKIGVQTISQAIRFIKNNKIL